MNLQEMDIPQSGLLEELVFKLLKVIKLWPLIKLLVQLHTDQKINLCLKIVFGYFTGLHTNLFAEVIKTKTNLRILMKMMVFEVH